jgi:hypothetical protein
VASRSAVESGNRLDRELAVDGFELVEISAILRPAGKTLEADHAGQAGDLRLLICDLDPRGSLDDGVVVERGEATLASPMTPRRSGPVGSRWGMAGTNGGRKQGYALLRELLTLFEALRGRERHVAGAKLLGLFAVDDGPLGLEEGATRTGAHGFDSSGSRQT